MKQFRHHLLFTLILSSLPVCKLLFGSLRHSTLGMDMGIITAGFFLGVSCYLWQQQVLSKERTSFLGLLILIPTLWQLAWISSVDFWFIKLVIILLPMGWLILYGGLFAPIIHWPVTLASILWAWFCDGKASIPESYFPWITKFSAWLVTVVMSPFTAISRVSSTVVMPDRQVLIGYPCTPISLLVLTSVLLILAVLLLQIPWRAAWRCILWSCAIGFTIGMVRLVWLVSIATTPKLFNYWHSPEGNAWFTAICIVLTALLVRKFVRFSGDCVEFQVDLRRDCQVLAISIGLGLLPIGQPISRPITPAPISGFPVLRQTIEKISPKSGEPDITQTFTYAGFKVTVHHIPNLLTGDAFDYGIGLGLSGKNVTFATFLSNGTRIYSKEQWGAHIDSNKGLRSFLRWCLHLQPLRDKEAYWAAFHWDGIFEKDKNTVVEAFTTQLHH